jgi:hypothetical protein
MLRLARGYPTFRYAMAMIGQSPSLPLSALTLYNKTVRAVNQRMSFMHCSPTYPAIGTPTFIPLFRMLILIAPCPCPCPWIPNL